MLWLCLALIPLAFAVALPVTWLVRAVSTRAGMLDAPGVPGQVKASARRVPNTGGIGIVVGFALPLAAGLAAVNTEPGSAWLAERFAYVQPHLAGVRLQTLGAIVLLAGVMVLHVLGLIDDRRPLGPTLKLAVMLATAAAVVMATNSRLLTLLDSHVGGWWLSVLVTVLWIGVITNAFNFLDNMDGLAAGVGAICAGCFLAVALWAHQWFIGATLALTLGAILGFLAFNFPRRPDGGATIFMGDGGSLVIGFLIALLSVRITYVHTSPHPAVDAFRWHTLLAPLIILAIPLYDFTSVTLIRLSQGRSPFVGDLQHFSHRLVEHGLSRRAAVLTIYGATAATGIGAIILPSLQPWQAVLVGVQTLLVLVVIALYEWSRPRAAERGRT